jgi:hypothetical protein
MRINCAGLICAGFLLTMILAGCRAPTAERRPQSKLVVDLLTNQTQHIPKLDSLNISGDYEEVDDPDADSLNEGCHIVGLITKNIKGYRYQLTTAENHYKGKVTVTRNPDKSNGIVFEGIPFADYEGDISKENDTDTRSPALAKPIGIGGVISGDTILMQNYGNAMNYYVQLVGIAG